MRQIVTLLMLVMADSVQAQDDDSPRWSVDAHIGGNALVSGSASGGDVPLYRSGSTSQSGLVTRLHVEYLLPIYFPLSVKAGYEHEEITMLKGDASYDLSQLSLGARWRPASPLWHVQPYAGFDVLWAPSAERGGMDMETRIGSLNYSYRARGVVRMPRFSMGPVVGADIYLFSHIALQAEYSYRLGLGSHYHVDYSDSRSHTVSAYCHGQPHRHVLTVGLKIDFPFRFDSDDVRGLLQGLLDLY